MTGGQSTKDDQLKATNQATAPSISLPKGGGAIRGIDEKWAANPVTGTGAMSVPIATSQGRSGFRPQLSLTYDSGSGNGPFGVGWRLALPNITRKTDKGLPTYHDGDDSDVYILSGSEDLVPVTGFTDRGEFRIQRYRPRIEGLFAVIERWTNHADAADTRWRVISRDNITTWYGTDDNSRIADPSDPTRIFSWLICQSYDDRGNALVYEYAAENDGGVDVSLANERNRVRTANRYFKRIRYGNRQPNRDTTWGATDPVLLPSDTWMFEVVFDHGEHDADAPSPHEAGGWTPRNDPHSSYRSGFEIRTYRLCQRILKFHHFPDETVGVDCLVRSADLSYREEVAPGSLSNPVFSSLTSVTQCGYKRTGSSYLKKTMPAVEFEYSLPTISTEVREIEGGENLPYGVDGVNYQWVELDGPGAS